MKKTTILLVGALLCLKKRKGERPKLKAYLLITLLLCLFNGQIIAQITKPLKMGDRLPEIFWQHRHNVYQNGNALTQNLAANKGKFIILDFWATWCGTCVSKFPLVDSLQKENPELKIILVNSTTVKEKPMALQTFFTKNLIGSKYQMPTIVGDTLLTKMFPLQ